MVSFIINPQLVVLDVSTDNYQWLAPVNATINQTPGLLRHNAQLYQDIMIVSFGRYDLSFFLIKLKEFEFNSNFLNLCLFVRKYDSIKWNVK